MTDIRDSLAEFGADPSALRLFDDEHPELLPYATLMTARRNGHATLAIVEAVYEWQGAPLVFLVDEDSLEDDSQLQQILLLLAMRGDGPYLGVVAPGSLCIYRIALNNLSLQQARVDWGGGAGTKYSMFARLGNLRPQAEITNQGWISNVVLRLLSGSTDRLVHEFDVSHEDAISLVGRALFIRFLADRDLLPEHMSEPETAASLFDVRDAAEKTSNWLDTTFNGELLPLSAGTFERLPPQGFSVLGDVLRRAPDGQLFLGWREKWANLDFAHIPVGVLSQAYELYLRKHMPDQQRREGGYYTPKPIAELMVRAAFGALGRQGIGKSAKVLDPAVGGGIFLLTAFRALVAEHWRADGERPDTAGLRRILYQQIVGFDINEAALRFAALGLYLLSIELDPNPRPVDKLRFEDLRGTVLHRVREVYEPEGSALGSLGLLVGEEHQGRYDLVIGNPPWASGTRLPGWNHVCETVASIATDRRISNTAPPLPNEALDLPFVWRAMEWAKLNGQIVFTLHARLLFQQGDGMPVARQALFEALDVTSVVNGVELRHTKVWPRISAPFCILFATNRTPGVEAGFRFISPRIEDSLNSSGIMRIDAVNAEAVPSQRLVETPDILKILFRGSKADFGILERIRAHGHPTLAGFWRERIGLSDRGRLRGSGNGYHMLRQSSRIRKGGDGQPGAEATYLHGLPEITVAALDENIIVDTDSLDVFSTDRIHDPRSRALFSGPLVVVHQSPPALTGRIRVAICDQDTVYSETFYGYSPGTHSEARLLVRYIALVLGSKLAIWFALVTSGKFGFERDVVEKATLDRIPLPDFEKLTPRQRREIDSLIQGLHSGEVSWEEVDKWVMCLYGLSQRDWRVVFDTLEYNLPFADNKRRAQAEPSSIERKRFCEVLREELRPWCDRFGSCITVDQIPPLTMSPWQAIAVCTGPHELIRFPRNDWIGLTTSADGEAASEILIDGSDCLVIVRLAQRRYWSETQARLLAQRIAWTHLDLLKRHANA